MILSGNVVNLLDNTQSCCTEVLHSGDGKGSNCDIEGANSSKALDSFLFLIGFVPFTSIARPLAPSSKLSRPIRERQTTAIELLF